ncbi:D-alanyl-D-alanine carboxypeptidase [Entomospira entomophila]|uniref:D-alanyl-D-alanine carboxypeptidase n=1 Tax=Entomospira entomophila TaxID=2719988 RepID=A0A968G8L7_9SPIO|nr:D-alanyl-D-alanine carboxypeptidase family protein [Entomospira entomophilus]NIZ40565.1 D-alanyl-D-alanine carboxypeptidase [Entomospira entomophilus]WDI36123.1 D-alanyl-D-alanine carboxypeptidase [Entomospira entomophilus]
MKNVILIFGIYLFMGLPAIFSADSYQGRDIPLYAQSVILIDAYSGRVLYEKNADKPHVPASLTKIISLTLAYEALSHGKITYNSPIIVSERASMHNVPYRSSRMYLEPGQNLKMYDLMLGMAIASGNDAAVALAETISGSVEQFVVEMNQFVQSLGATNSLFVDPAGIFDGNIITAREYAQFAKYYIEKYPQALKEIHSVPAFSYPNLQQMNHRGSQRYTVTHRNPIGLIGSYEGADGLKTGYVDESGYNLVATIQQDSMRFIAVILGVFAPGSQTGSRQREEDAKKLFDYAISNYKYYEWEEHPMYQDNLSIRVLGGKQRNVAVTIDTSSPYIEYPLTVDEWQNSRVTLKVDKQLAPLDIKSQVGVIAFEAGEQRWQAPLVIAEAIERLPFWLYFNDMFKHQMRRILRR